MSRIAMCQCGSPLVMTFVFSGREFYCLDCGRTYDFLGPDAAEETPELLARMEAAQAEALPLLAALVVRGSRLAACELCQSGSGDHHAHATEAEWEADRAARVALAERASQAGS